LKKTIKGLIQLTQINEYIYIVSISSLLGIVTVQQTFDWHILLVMIANLLAVGLTYIVHNIKNAPDDVFSNQKFNQNPIAKGVLSPSAAKITAGAVVIMTLGLYATLGRWPLIFGSLILALGYLFSIRGVHHKSGTLFDIWAHSVIFSALQFLVGFFSFRPHPGRNWYWSLIFIISIQAVIALNRNIKLNEENISQGQVTAGQRLKLVIRFTSMITAAFSGVMAFIIDELLPIWVIALAVGLSGILLIPSLIKHQRDKTSRTQQNSIQKHLEIAGVLALVLYFILPLFW